MAILNNGGMDRFIGENGGSRPGMISGVAGTGANPRNEAPMSGAGDIGNAVSALGGIFGAAGSMPLNTPVTTRPRPQLQQASPGRANIQPVRGGRGMMR